MITYFTHKLTTDLVAQTESVVIENDTKSDRSKMSITYGNLEKCIKYCINIIISCSIFTEELKVARTPST